MFEHICILANKIKEDFSNIKKTYHLGNYNSLGDIFIETPEKKYFIEIKMSYTRTGIGTQANISQNALILNGLFEKDTLHWSDFRVKLNHSYWVNKILNMFKDYPKEIILIKNKILQFEEKARYLRDIKK